MGMSLPMETKFDLLHCGHLAKASYTTARGINYLIYWYMIDGLVDCFPSLGATITSLIEPIITGVLNYSTRPLIPTKHNSTL